MQSPDVHPDTPDWFKPYWDQNQREHEELRTDLSAGFKHELNEVEGRIIAHLEAIEKKIDAQP